MCDKPGVLLAQLNDILVLDGGFSTQLACYVGARVDGDPLWSARFLQTNPDDVAQTHLDFLRAGADIIMTNTYQASVGGFVKHLGTTTEHGYSLIRLAVDLAKQARDKYLQECQQKGLPQRKVLIAGSVGPYGAHLHDGSEYDGSYVDKTSVETMREWHLPRIKTLVESGVDLLAFETAPCHKEAEMLLQLLKKEFPDTKAWLTFSVKDDQSLAHGENFKEVVTKCWELNPDQLVAIGVNCCSPKIVKNLFEGINVGREKPIPFITYPNSGEKYNTETGWVNKDNCESLDRFVDDWIKVGVRFIGGCCRTHDTDVAKIRNEVDKWKAKN